MSTLYLDRKNLFLRLDGHAMALYEDSVKRGTVPLKLLERVVVRGNLELESRLLCALADNKVDLLVLSGRYSRMGSMAFAHSHKDAKRRLAQYRFFQEKQQLADLSRQLVLGKCRKQLQLLHRAMQKRGDLRRIITQAVRTISEIESTLTGPECLATDSLRGLEGAAAAAYFSVFTALFAESLGFFRRRKRPPPDPVNACLSLGYTLLHFEAVSVCHIVGLDPLLGFYHEPAYGRDSLACDLMEPVRPRLDGLVWYLFRNKLLRSSHFTQEKGGCLLNKSGRKIFYAHYESFVLPVRRLLRLEGHKLAKFYIQSAAKLC